MGRSEGSPIATWPQEESPSSIKIRPHDRDLTATRRPIFFYSWRRSRASDSNLTVAKIGGKTVRSRPDRTAIAARSSRDRCSFSGGIASRQPDDDRRSTRTKIMAQSRCDRGPIVARSRSDRAENHAFFEAKLKLIPRGIEATTHAQGSASTTLENRPTNASIADDHRANFPL